MSFEFVKIEKRANPDAIGQPWFSVAECMGRDGCFVRAVGFASELPPFLSEISRDLLNRGIRQGQRGIVRITRTYPKGEQVYYRFTAQ
jgi:hypothetical protein